MKRFLMFFAVVCGATMLHAQSGSELLGSLSEKMEAMGSYHIDFEVEMAGAAMPSKGYCEVSGNMYVIAVEDMRQGCDGTTQWVFNGVNREVTFDNPRTDSRSLFDNPTKAFDFTEELFEVESVTHEAAMIHLRLLPKEGVLDGVERVLLTIDEATMLPSSLGYDMAGLGLYVNIVDIKPITATKADFEVRVPYGFEVIDFR